MGRHNWVTTILRCARHNRDSTLCVRVELEVPGPLRCQPGGGGGGGSGGVLSPCPCGGGITPGDLQRRVSDAMLKALGRWLKQGAVVIEC